MVEGVIGSTTIPTTFGRTRPVLMAFHSRPLLVLLKTPVRVPAKRMIGFAGSTASAVTMSLLRPTLSLLQLAALFELIKNGLLLFKEPAVVGKSPELVKPAT